VPEAASFLECPEFTIRCLIDFAAPIAMSSDLLPMTDPAATEMHSETSRHPAGSLAELLAVALPLIASSGSQCVMNVTDRMFLTWYSQESLAAVLPSGMLHWSLISLAFGMCQYANTFVAQYEGAKQKERVAASVWQAAYIAIFAGLLLSSAGFASEAMFQWIGHSPDVAVQEADYFRVLAFGSVAPVLATAMSTFFSGRGQTAVVMWVNLLGATTNIVFDYGLIFGVGPFPELGIQGAAIATVLGSVAQVIAYAALIFRTNSRQTYGTWANRGWDAGLVRRFLKFGFPAGLHMFVDVAGFAIFMLLIGKLGKTELAATNLAFNLNSLAFIPMLGLGIAISTLVGHRIGEGRPELAIKTTWNAFAISSIYMGFFAAIYVLVPDVIVRPYLANAKENISGLQEQIAILLRFVALYSFFDAMAIVFGSAVRGAGDTRFALVFSFMSCWLLMVGPTWWLWHFEGGSLVGSWWACSAYVLVLGLGFLARFQAGHWKSMSVIEATAIETNAEPNPDVMIVEHM